MVYSSETSSSSSSSSSASSASASSASPHRRFLLFCILNGFGLGNGLSAFLSKNAIAGAPQVPATVATARSMLTNFFFIFFLLSFFPVYKLHSAGSWKSVQHPTNGCRAVHPTHSCTAIYFTLYLIAILQNTASDPIYQSVEYCVRNLCRASARRRFHPCLSHSAKSPRPHYFVESL